MKITCPACQIQIPGEQINVATDVAFCPQCEQMTSVSDMLASGQDLAGFDLGDPPKGVHFEETYDGWKLETSTRSWAALFLVPFMCVWSGGSLGGIYGGQILAGKFNLMASLFGIPFLLGTIVLGSMAAMTVFGKIVVSTSYDQGKVFTGVGPIGWTQNFDWASVTHIRKDSVAGSDGDVHPSSWQITLVGDKRTKIYIGLNEDRRLYILNALRSLMNVRSTSRHIG